jgi:hypothetical protein
MKRRKITIGVVIVATIAVVFFLPLIPVRVEAVPCIQCAGLFLEEQGYSSVGLYFFGYGGIYLSGLSNYYASYVGYCMVYGTSTSCGVGLALLKST